MKRLILAGVLVAAACGEAVYGQAVDLSSLDKLGEKAREKNAVNMDGDQLKMAMGFMNQGAVTTGQRSASDAFNKLLGLRVRTFEFGKKGAYSQSDLDAVRQQVQGKGWSKIIETKETDESAEIYSFNDGSGGQGMLIIAAESDELSVVNLLGAIDFQTLGALGGDLKIPNFGSGFKNGGPAKPKTPKPPKPPKSPQE